MNKKVFQHIAVLMGGISAERDISMRSGKAVAEGLRSAGRIVTEIDIRAADFRLPGPVDGAFIALHGEFGEDGQVQSILERLQIPYTGSGPASSRIAFNKKLAKQVFLEHNIRTPDHEVLLPEQKRTLALPVVVKPISQGSSLGVHLVFREEDWEEAFADALSHNGEVIVEEYIDGLELTVGIVCDEVLPVLEIRAPRNNYDYYAKYSKGVTEYKVPADLDEIAAGACKDLSARSFEALRCSGFGRADLRMGRDGLAYMLEVNTIPGFTETSLLPKAAMAAGCDFSRLCDRIMQAAALDRDRSAVA